MTGVVVVWRTVWLVWFVWRTGWLVVVVGFGVASSESAVTKSFRGCVVGVAVLLWLGRELLDCVCVRVLFAVGVCGWRVMSVMFWVVSVCG